VTGKWLCKIGIHRPLKILGFNFTDAVSYRKVYDAKCRCGLKWLTDSAYGWFGFKMRKEE